MILILFLYDCVIHVFISKNFVCILIWKMSSINWFKLQDSTIF